MNNSSIGQFFWHSQRKIVDYFLLLELRAQVHKERRELSKLDHRALKDIGISHEDAACEAHRAYADIPVDLLRHKTTDGKPHPAIHRASCRT